MNGFQDARKRLGQITPVQWFAQHIAQANVRRTVCELRAAVSGH
jgi:hypothetical protein